MGRSTRARRRPTYADLVAKLRDVESRLGQLNALERVQHDLATHQEELEIQNQKLRESRKEIEQSHDRYVDLFDLAPVGYATLDEKGLVCDMNLRASTLLETERLRQVGMPFFVHVLQEDRRTYLDYFARCKRATERSEIEIRLRTRTGTIVPVLLTTRRCSASGAATRYSTAMIDLRERHRAEAARRRAEEERQRVLRENRAAEAANATKDRFIAVLSHELRTPLTPVLIMLESAQHRGLVSDQLRPMFDLMRRSIELEARLIDDLLDVTRIRQGKLRLDRETINLHALIAEVLETYRPQVEADGLTVETRLSARATWLRADPDRIRQVIWNLLQNALRNTPAAGAIELETRDGVPGMVVVRVRDNGRGMTPDVLDRVFQPFEQGPDRRGGLGLGLSICRGLVEAHGGRIIAASPGVGRGSTFEVELPTTPQPDISAVAPAHVSERAGAWAPCARGRGQPGHRERAGRAPRAVRVRGAACSDARVRAPDGDERRRRHRERPRSAGRQRPRAPGERTAACARDRAQWLRDGGGRRTEPRCGLHAPPDEARRARRSRRGDPQGRQPVGRHREVLLRRRRRTIGASCLAPIRCRAMGRP
jgi:PAS domain S-box-containing protein